MDKMGPLQPIPRGGRSWGKKVSRRPARYQRTGTIQRLAAFAPYTGQSVGMAYKGKKAEDVRDFLENILLPAFPQKHIHMIWDNLSCHKSQIQWQQNFNERISFV